MGETIDEDGNLIQWQEINTQVCEQLIAWLAGYESILKRMTSQNFNWFIHTMLVYHVKHVLAKMTSMEDDESADEESSDEESSNEESSHDKHNQEEETDSKVEIVQVQTMVMIRKVILQIALIMICSFQVDYLFNRSSW